MSIDNPDNKVKSDCGCSISCCSGDNSNEDMLEIKDIPDKQDRSDCGCSTSCCSDNNAIEIMSGTGFALNQRAGGMSDPLLVSAKLTFKDRLGALMVRLGIARMSYIITPGLYKVGSPDQGSPVLVSANYKLSFDTLRSALTGRDLWILVIDTKGINVWCAAGKGTFNSREIAKMTSLTGLEYKVKHRTLILPQLSAPGVSAHEVTKLCGFKVIYGPVRARDIPEFIDAGFKASPSMRHVEFSLKDRIILTPVEIVMGLKYIIIISAGLMILSGIGVDGYSIRVIKDIGIPSALIFTGAFIGSVFLGSALLPWLPGRAFAVKGLIVGVLMVIIEAVFCNMGSGIIYNKLMIASWVFIIPALSSFVVMNFTGATTFTSLSGVLYEMRYALPAQIGAALIGFTLWAAGLFI